MLARCLDLRDDIDANPGNPTGDRVWRVTDIKETENLDDVIAFLCDDSKGPLDPRSDKYLTFRVPNTPSPDTGAVISPRTLWNRIYRKSIKPAWDGPFAAICVVRYGVLDALPHPTVGGSNPSNSKEDGGQGKDEVYGPEFSSDTSGGTVHILQLDESISDIDNQPRMKRKYAYEYNYATNTMSDTDKLNGLIGLNGDKVEGVDIQSGGNVFTVTQKGVPVTPNYEAFLDAVEFSVNSVRCFNRDVEEILYIGSKKAFKPGEGWNVTHSFERGRTRLGAKIAGFVIPVIKPFDHVWTTYETTVASGQRAKRPTRVFVDRVYPTADHRRIFDYRQ